MMRRVLVLLCTALALSACSDSLGQSPTPTAVLIRLPAASPSSTAEATATARPTEVAQKTLMPSPATPADAGTAVPSPTAQAGPAAPHIMALGVHPSIALWARPGGAVSATVAGSTVLWVEGRSADGQWLLVSYGRPVGHAWANRADLNVFGKLDKVAEVAADAAEQAANSEPGAETGAGQATPTTGTSAVPGGLAGQVTGEHLNVRRAPGVDQTVIGSLSAGSAITVTGRSAEGQWLRIGWAGGEGWVATPYVSLSGDATSLPVAGQASTPLPAARAAPVAGKIAFQTANGGDIYVMNADGSGLRRVASGIDPALSPDGTRLAYAHWEEHSQGIYVLDLTSGAAQEVVSAVRPRWPIWSSDGARLAFARSRRTTTCLQTPFGCVDESAVRKALGGRDCVNTPYGRFCISDFPAVDTDDTGLSQINLENGALQDLPAALLSQAPSWQPQSEQIVYRASKSLQSVTAQGDLHTFVDDTQVNCPAWSPDGQRVAVQKHLHDHDDIFLYDAAGNMVAQLTAPEFLAEHASNNVSPTWSPDGRTILFLTDRSGQWQIYRMNADGSGQEPFLPAALGKIALRYDFAAEHVVSWGR
jgi:Tol biopolymer transport system component